MTSISENPIKRITRLLLLLSVLSIAGTNTLSAQAVKVNIPTTVVGTPNVGAEFTISQQFSVNGDLLWAPYMFKKHEEVFRALIGSVDLRYYFSPKYYYTNDMFDGFYAGPYAMYGNYNIGLYRGEGKESFRHTGWGVSGGISLGYKMYLSKRFRLDANLGLGFAHLQYDKFPLGGEWAEYPLAVKDTKAWVGPTKFGIHLVYNLFR
jgi:hypothetical protein